MTTIKAAENAGLEVVKLINESVFLIINNNDLLF